MADLPGLIEGAHHGAGLGHEFLRHVERTRVILHVIDMAATEGREPYADFLKINQELEQYNAKLLECPHIIVANKMDVAEAEDNLSVFREQLHANGIDYPVFAVSTVTKLGLRELLLKTMEVLEQTPVETSFEDAEEERIIYRLKNEQAIDGKLFDIRIEDGVYVIDSIAIEKLMKRTNFRTEQSIMRFAHTMRKMGIDEALRKLGAKDGDPVRIGKFEFEFVEHQ
jgi:GTP-binding protein